jgi:ABC-type multidrug transport system fused ATPase/permease subunit
MEKRDSLRIKQSFELLSKRDRPRFLAAVSVSIFLGFLDLVGVAAVGAIGSLAVVGLSTGNVGNRVSALLSFLGIAEESFKTQVFILGTSAAVLFLFRTAVSIYLNRRVFHFLARKSSEESNLLLRRYLSQTIDKINSRTHQEILYALTTGVSSVLLGVLGLLSVIFADVILLTVMLTGLFVIDPFSAMFSFAAFSLIGFLLFFYTKTKAKAIGENNRTYTIKTYVGILASLQGYRELFVSGRLGTKAREIEKNQHKLSSSLAEQQLLPNLSKYIVEASLVLIGLTICGLQFAISSPERAIAGLSLFIAAGSRIAPAVMRIQQSAIQIKSNLKISAVTFEILDELNGEALISDNEVFYDFDYLGFSPEIELTNVSFSYLGSESELISGLNLRVKPGEKIALVGPSGSGKSTIVDLILGVLEPNSGKISISKESPKSAILKWPGSIAYVPQEIKLLAGSLKENITQGIPENLVDRTRLVESLKFAHLDKFVSDLPEGIESQVGESGSNLSGGQRQRVGLARAAYSNPLMLVLDEATSALDAESELYVSSAIAQLPKMVTVIIIAHRLSTVRNVDRIIYVSNGEIVYQGTFEDVRRAIPDFDNQATLMGL